MAQYGYCPSDDEMKAEMDTVGKQLVLLSDEDGDPVIAMLFNTHADAVAYVTDRHAFHPNEGAKIMQINRMVEAYDTNG